MIQVQEKMNNISIQYYKTSLGELILGSFQGQLCLCDWRYRAARKAVDERIRKGLGSQYVHEGSEITGMAKTQLDEYLDGRRTIFEIPLKMVGTPFQQKVWNELLTIPYGHSETYENLSKKLKNVNAIRAVAAANGANAISIFIPCHRIIGKNGALVGYAGGLAVKRKLLKLEHIIESSEQLLLF